MINELYELSKALNSVHIQAQNWHRKYKPIPNIRNNTPCVCVTISNGQIIELSELDAKFDKILRKYGSNQGSYPCMNLAPLYRIKDEAIKAELSNFIRHPERIGDAGIRKIETWCTEDNWGAKFCGKYKISMEKMPAELQSVAGQCEPLRILMDETNYFTDASILHRELERFAWQMIQSGQNVALALTVLFYLSKEDKTAEEDYGSISIAFESQKLIDNGFPAISEKFVSEVNRHLLEIEAQKRGEEPGDSIDAFGISFKAIEEPMPSVKLAGGFDATIRTMFKEQRCQSRYGRIENASYPISPSMRMQFQSALEWVGSAAQKNITWINIDQDEILFAYPLSLPDISSSCTAMFKQSENKSIAFSEKAKQFIQELQKTKSAETDPKSKQIRIFVLKKIDKARTKVIYTRRTDAFELEKCSEAWTYGCANLPAFPFGIPQTPYPMTDFQNFETRYLTSLWRAPIVVTTAVTFFETLASNHPSTLRRLHELPGSMIFIDEAHNALPLKLLPLAWRWMNTLSNEWSCYWVLASGSLVRYWELDRLTEIEMERPMVAELVHPELRGRLMTYEHGRVVFCRKEKPVSREELIDLVQKVSGPRLLILNTVQNAAVIASDLCNKLGRSYVEHLSTALTPEDRGKVIDRVKKRLENKSDTDWTLVATSCVEAGVDFSFRTGFREMSSLLSLLQAAGRVNRHGNFANAEMWSFSLRDDSVLTRNKGVECSAKVLHNYFQKGIPVTPELSTCSMNDEIILDDSCIKTIRHLMEQEEAMQFQTVDNEFRVIDSDTVPAVIDASLATAIAAGKGDWHELQKKSVSIRRYKIKEWGLQEIAAGVYRWTLGYDDFLGYMHGVLNMGVMLN